MPLLGRCLRTVVVLAAVSSAGPVRADEIADLAPDRAASFMLWSDAWVEVGVGYRGGMVRQSFACINEAGDYATGGCVAGDNTVIRSGTSSQPGGLVGRLAVFPARTLGVGADLSADWPQHTDFEDESLAIGGHAATGPAWDLLVGPVFRLHGPVERMVKALRFRASPGLYVRHAQIKPMAGNAGLASAPVLDSGTYAWTLAGFGLSLEIEAEMARSTTFRGVALGGIGIPAEPPSLTTTNHPDSGFVAEEDAVRLGSGGAGLQLGFAFVAPRGVIAVEPSLVVRWSRTVLTVDDELSFDAWSDDGEPQMSEVMTYSTRQDVLAIYGQITIRSAIGPRS